MCLPVAVPARPRILAGRRFLRISPNISPNISPDRLLRVFRRSDFIYTKNSGLGRSDFIYTKNSARLGSDFIYTKNSARRRSHFIYTKNCRQCIHRGTMRQKIAIFKERKQLLHGRKNVMPFGSRHFTWFERCEVSHCTGQRDPCNG